MHLSYICKKCGTSDQDAKDCPNCTGKIVLVSFQEYKALKHAYNLVGYKNPLDSNNKET